MRYFFYFIHFTLLGLGYNCMAQQQVQTFNKIFKVKETASAQIVRTVTETDNALIMGLVLFHDTYYMSTIILKTDKNADSVFWSDKFGSNSSDKGYYVTKTLNTRNENNIMATGLVHYYTEYKQDVLLMKLDMDGNQIWEKTFQSDTFPGSDSRAYDIDLTPDNGFILTGTVGIAGLILKIDSAGNKIWEHTIGKNITSKYVLLESCIVLPDSGLLIGGNSDNGHEHFEGEAFVIKLDKNGKFLWKKSFGGNYKDRGTHLVINKNGDIYGVYERYTKTDSWGEPQETKISLFKIDEEGNTLFENQFGSQDIVYWPKSISILDNGDLLIAGEWLNMANSWMFRLSPAGDSIWYKEYQPPIVSPPINLFSFSGAMPIKENEILAFGEASTNSAEDNYCWLVKTNYSGCLANINITSQPDTLIIANPNDEIVLTLSAKSSKTISYQWYKNDTLITGAVDSVFVISSFTDNDAGNYYCLLSNSCETISSNIVKVKAYNYIHNQHGDANWFVLMPNPASSSILLKPLASTEQITDITLFSINGKRMFKITENNISNSNEIKLDISTLPAGLYIISVIASDKTGVKKFLKVN